MADPDWLERADRIESAGIREFGEPIVYTPAGGSPEPIRAVFDTESVEGDLEVGFIRTYDPSIEVRLADLSGPPKQGDGVVVRGISWTVQVPEDDGAGGARLPLRRL